MSAAYGRRMRRLCVTALVLACFSAAAPAPAGAIVGGTGSSASGSVGFLGNCHAVAISPSVALTRGVCLASRNVISINTTKRSTPLSVFVATRAVLAPDRGSTPVGGILPHDLAYLDFAFPITNSVAPVSRVRPANGNSFLTRGFGATAPGGGFTDTMNEGGLTVAGCPGTVPGDVFCTGYAASGNRSLCDGDLGTGAFTGTALVGLAVGAGPTCQTSFFFDLASNAATLDAALAPRFVGRVYDAVKASAAGQTMGPDDAMIAGRLPGATVTALRPDGSTAGTATAKEDGSYALPLPAGTYVLRTEAAGYRTTTTAGKALTEPQSYRAELITEAAAQANSAEDGEGSGFPGGEPPPAVADPRPGTGGRASGAAGGVRAQLISLVRRRDGRLALTLEVTGLARPTTLRVSVLPKAGARVARRSVRVAKTGTLKLVLTPSRALRRKQLAGRRFRVAVSVGKASLLSTTAILRRP